MNDNNCDVIISVYLEIFLSIISVIVESPNKYMTTHTKDLTLIMKSKWHESFSCKENASETFVFGSMLLVLFCQALASAYVVAVCF